MLKNKKQKLGIVILGIAILLGGSFFMCWILKPALVKNFGKAMQVQDDDGFVTISQAYSENTHQLIAEQAVILYHQIYGQWLSTQEIEWVKQGASREDTPPRWVNHFYDPTTGQGWNAQRMGQVPSSVLKLFSKISLSRQNPLSLLNWLHNQTVQNKYQLYEGDRTFDRAIADYIKGDKQRAFQSLGHSLHLIADATVPAHTRQDTHVDALGDPGEPYEKWVKEQTNQKGLAIFADLAGLTNNYQPICQGVDDCLKKSAQYSNTNFFSEDTIFDFYYQKPADINEVIESKNGQFAKYGIDQYGRHLFFVREIFSKSGKLLSTIKTVKEETVLSDYWKYLSRQALLASIETIHDFKIQTDKAKQNPPQNQENKTLSQPKKNQSLIGLFGNNMPIIGQQILDKAPVVSPYGELSRVGNFLSGLWNKASGLLSSISDVFSSAKNQINVSLTPAISNLQPQPTNPSQPANQPVNTQNQSLATHNSQPVTQTLLSKLLPPLSQKNPIPNQAPTIQEDEDNVGTEDSNGQEQNNIPTKPNTPNLPDIKNNKYSASPNEQTLSSSLAPVNNSPTQAVVTPTTTPITIPITTPTSTPVILAPPVILSPVDQSQVSTDLIILQGQAQTTTAKIFIEINNNASSTQGVIVQADGTWQAQIILSPGQNDFKIWAQDSQGQKSAEVFWQIIYDTQGPEIVLTLSDYQMTSGEITLSWQSATSTPSTDIVQYLLQYQADSGAWQDLWQIATSTQKAFSGFIDGQYVFRACGQDRIGNQGVWRYVNVFFNHRPVVINEVAWMGTLASADDEWLELYNLTDQEIDLTGWILSAKDGSPSTTLKGFIKPNGYYLLERTDDTTIKDIPADLIYTGALNNSDDKKGEALTLKDNLGNVIDSFDFTAGWPAGDNTAKLSMEKIRPQDDGSLADSWMNFSGLWQGFLAANGSQLLGTPGAINSFQANGGTLLVNDLVITGTVHWTKKFSPYILPANMDDFVTVADGAKLIIDPGVVVKMPPFYLGIRVLGDLEAVGTDSEAIIFEPQTGQNYWSLIAFDSGGQGVFDWVIFKSGGAPGYHSNGLAQVNTQSALVANESALSIVDCIFDNLAIGGVVLNNSQALIEDSLFLAGVAKIKINSSSQQVIIRDNIFQGGVWSGIGIDIGAGQPQILNNRFDGVGTIAWLGGGAPIFSGNTSQNIQRYDGIFVSDKARFDQNITWQNNFSYILEVNFRDQMRVLTGAILTIEPGTVIKTASGAPAVGYEATIIEGGLNAQAPTSTPIVFTSIFDDTFGGDTNCDGGATTPTSDLWRGLYFADSSAGSVLDGVLFRYADEATIKESDTVDLTLGEVGYD